MPILSALIGEKLISTGGKFSEFYTGAQIATGLPPNSGNGIVVTSPTTSTTGRFCRVLLSTANGANAIGFYDTNGFVVGPQILGYIPANAPAGSVYDFQIPFKFGIAIPVTAAAANITITFSY